VKDGSHCVIFVGGGAQTTYDQRGGAHNHPPRNGESEAGQLTVLAIVCNHFVIYT